MLIQQHKTYRRMLGDFIRTIDDYTLGMHVVSESKDMINVLTNRGETLSFTDFECVNINTGAIHSKKYCQFIIKELDKIDKRYGDEFVNAWHDYLEQDTIYGPIK